jgi:hypothetical protein
MLSAPPLQRRNGLDLLCHGTKTPEISLLARASLPAYFLTNSYSWTGSVLLPKDFGLSSRLGANTLIASSNSEHGGQRSWR